MKLDHHWIHHYTPESIQTVG